MSEHWNLPSPQDLDLIFRVNVQKLLQQYVGVDRPHEAQRRWCNPEYRVHCRLCRPEGPLRLFDEQRTCSSDDLLGCERLSDKIRCNCISPARVHKRLSMVFSIRTTRDLNRKLYDILARSQPIGRMAQPHEIASLALFLCSEEASFMTGCDYPIDGVFFNLR